MFEKLKSAIAQSLEKLSKKVISEKDLEDILWELQLMLVQNDVAYDAAEKIISDVKDRLIGIKVSRFGNVKELAMEVLRDAISSIITIPDMDIDVINLIEEKRKKGEPAVLLFVGINGTGKTTTIAKLAYYLRKRGYRVVLAAADTFRAGSIEQLKIHADKLNLRVISHKYGSDAAAVAYDAIEHAKARNIDVVLIDTAGRMQTDRNLMDEVSKIKRIANPDLTILIVDSLTGNDAVQQAITFNNYIGVDAIILTKTDADEKGGTAISVVYSIKKPIIFIGTGQKYEDLAEFNPKFYLERILP
ncbi:MAG: signal recognition particle-docking protein FtsY [Candidatus Odinarchaeota archaeon]|nr:signal recognition particle-docking protein FtsY [Candidatus Odinarchaeota archaeon]